MVIEVSLNRVLRKPPMKTGLHIAMILAMVLAGFPHLFCGCGCSGTARAEVTQAAPPACPHCCQAGDDSAPQRGREPCECGGCEVSKTVMSDAVVAVTGPQHNLLSTLLQKNHP